MKQPKTVADGCALINAKISNNLTKSSFITFCIKRPFLPLSYAAQRKFQ